MIDHGRGDGVVREREEEEAVWKTDERLDGWMDGDSVSCFDQEGIG